jgi:putative ABC transport system ATP-binding protein
MRGIQGDLVTAIIRANNLHKTYDTGKIKVDALRGIDLEIQPGEMVAIMGPSGCGKTTLLNCLSGLDGLTDGEVFIEEQRLADLNDNQRTEYRANKMGFVFQFYNLLPVLTAVENVELPLLVSGTKKKDAREKALTALEMVGLREWKDHRPAELSGGQRQRVTIARALVNKPAIVWADEPTGDLDSDNSNDIMKLMQQLNQEHGQTFVIVTHEQRIGDMTQRIIQMENGKIVREDVPAGAPSPPRPTPEPSAAPAIDTESSEENQPEG